MPPQNTPESFWKKVKRGRGCWLWLGAVRTRDGYGGFTLCGKKYSTHRISWMYSFGEIPKDMCVLHHCDNPLCVRPSHLFLGTLSDNMIDMTKKERHPCRKLNRRQVNLIRWVGDSITQQNLGKIFGVSQSQVKNILRYKQWKW
jgi:hypothetical protein